MTNVPAGKAPLTVTVTGIFHLPDTWNNSREIWPKQPESFDFLNWWRNAPHERSFRQEWESVAIAGNSERSLFSKDKADMQHRASLPLTHSLFHQHTHSARIRAPVVGCMYIHDMKVISISHYQVIQSFLPPSTSGYPQCFHGSMGNITACQMA